MAEREVKIFPDITRLTDYFVSLLQSVLKSSDKNENISIALSGGSTPKLLFEQISNHHRVALDWKKLNYFFGDERCVSPENEESNFRMVNESLFVPLGIGEENIFRIEGESDQNSEADRYAKILSQNVAGKNGIPVFDVVVLGLGEDGHTASIFPNQMELFYSSKLCEVAVHPATGQMRITLTGKVINNSKLVVFIVTGKNKSGIVSRILDNPSRESIYPASLVAPVNGELIWLLDSDAASELNSTAPF